ncbi:DEAD/DEAH box helicase [Paenibacillus hubeiensis]|uniref:DEAD/DEAH box helicase n=1 Tax=Paenibacillus hubeiensis TaxID=3077330 RepID=UPI0031BB2066
MLTTEILTLPEIQRPLKKYSVGYSVNMIRQAEETVIVSQTEVQYFNKRKDMLYILENGERIVVTSKKIKNIPNDLGVDGVLLDSDGELKWIWHRRLDSVLNNDDIKQAWVHQFQFKQEISGVGGELIARGLRPPQIGALHSIGAHWSISKQAATIVMPTGTGKTETMLATMINYPIEGSLLVVVPSKALRDQISKKFLKLGLLRLLGNISYDIPNPIVGVLNKRPVQEEDLEIFNDCNVVIATINTVAQGTASSLLNLIANKCGCLILDEAHHVAAESWNLIKDAFQDKKVIQFTATPFRRDGKTVDGKIIYSYPLVKAQMDGYFKPIKFQPVFELRNEHTDKTIADKAISILNSDLEQGLDHILMARCSSVDRANEVFTIYRNIANHHKPIILHSKSVGKKELLDKVISRESRIVICVDMLGEGFDLPQLKIAAVHDTHKSLSVLLQFIGRFTRTSGDRLGDATVIANIANPATLGSLERLYSEDADWNFLLREYTSEAMKEHAKMVEFLQNSEQLFSSRNDKESKSLSPKMLFPKYSAAVYRCEQFVPREFYQALNDNQTVRGAWINETENSLYFVTESQIKVNWSRVKTTYDQKWDLYIVYYNPELKLLFIHSSEKSSLHQELADAISNYSATLQMGDAVFRTLVGISRLVFQNVGLKKPGRRNLRYAMYTGADVAQALSPSQKSSSTKSNVYGSGFEEGMPVSIGCSYKGRIWSKDQGPIFRFIKWCDNIGKKIINTSINTEEIIDNVIIPQDINCVPDKGILNIDWPVELLQRNEDSISLLTAISEVSFANYSIEYVETQKERNQILFKVVYDSFCAVYSLSLYEGGYRVERVSGSELEIKVGKIRLRLEEWFRDYPPSLLFVDGSELDGNLLIEPKKNEELAFPLILLDSWNWDGIDITKESQWKDGIVRTNSIQHRVIQEFFNKGYEVVFDDDDSGEAADVICILEETDKIKVALIHCKFSGGSSAGQRVKDVMEVCGQASRSVKWAWRFVDLCKHMQTRNNPRNRRGRATRFFNGNLNNIMHYSKLSRFKPVEFEVYIVQPGLSKEKMTDEQINILASAYGYILEITGIELKVICSQ